MPVSAVRQCRRLHRSKQITVRVMLYLVIYSYMVVKSLIIGGALLLGRAESLESIWREIAIASSADITLTISIAHHDTVLP
jgi:uncharacterized membrane protein